MNSASHPTTPTTVHAPYRRGRNSFQALLVTALVLSLVTLSASAASVTTLVKDINPIETPPPSHQFVAAPRAIVAVGDLVYFVGWDRNNGYELWKSDGTAAGTIVVRDINPSYEDSLPSQLTNVNGTLFFPPQTWVLRTTSFGKVTAAQPALSASRAARLNRPPGTLRT